MFVVGRRNNSFSALWPVVLAVLSTVLLLLDPIRHILLDHGGVFFQVEDLAMYTKINGHVALSVIGRLSQIATVVGFILLLLAIAGYFNLPQRCFGKPKACSADGE